MRAQCLCPSSPWSEVSGEPVQQCWRWLQLQGNAVTCHRALHFVQTPGPNVSAGTSQPSWGGEDACSNHRCGENVTRLSWYLRALIWTLTSVCVHVLAFSCRPDRVKPTVLVSCQALSCQMPARTVKNKLLSHPTPCTFWCCLWASGAQTACFHEKQPLIEPRCGLASTWE